MDGRLASFSTRAFASLNLSATDEPFFVAMRSPRSARDHTGPSPAASIIPPCASRCSRWTSPGRTGRRTTPAAAKLLKRAADAGADLALLPEMFATGFSMDGAKIAQPPGGPSERWLRGMARGLGLHLIAGLAETCDAAGAPSALPRNNALWVTPDGEVARYTKLHPFSFAGEDETVFAAGESVVDVGDRRRARDAAGLLRPALPGAVPPRGGRRPTSSRSSRTGPSDGARTGSSS